MFCNHPLVAGATESNANHEDLLSFFGVGICCLSAIGVPSEGSSKFLSRRRRTRFESL